MPDINLIIVPVGGRSVAARTYFAAKTINKNIQVIGVMSVDAPAAYESWRAKQLLEDEMGTFVEKLATRKAFALPQAMLWELPDEFFLVSDDEFRRAIVVNLEKALALAAGPGASPLAAALKINAQLRDIKIALVLNGGDISVAQLR